ncbi:thioesterase superfamily protein [Murinocardiopsis flavida]|uniref:Acyl-coenzyme A thioesterase THEM4 n=1 Tax=Murinocardiopsis flavida TaxID=645275 RepID=A0A2P8D3N3_9ACTN|nr:PaaI family thioesterase [Murinocardiopsis flavida]PSK91825.1 thioesterase superfamily protein [Murinocardiopsis flavida]
MTVDAQPVAELPDPRDFGFTVVHREELSDELLALVEDARALNDAVAHTDVAPEALAQARAAIAAATETLNGARRPTGAMVAGRDSRGRPEYGTIANIVAGPVNPAAPPLELAHTDDGVRGEVTLNGSYEGPPGLVHGGWVAALLDQALGSAASAAGMPGLTAHLDVDYRNPTPLHNPLTVTARVTGTERRKVFVSAEIRHNGELTAEGTAIMVQLMLPS